MNRWSLEKKIGYIVFAIAWVSFNVLIVVVFNWKILLLILGTWTLINWEHQIRHMR